MSTTEKDPQIVKLNGVRNFFPNYFSAKSYRNEAGKPKYFGARYGIIKTDTATLAAINAAIMAAAVGKWGDKAQTTLLRLKAENRLCMTDGDIKKTEGFAGNFVLSCNRREQDGPPLVLTAGRVKLTEDKGELYSGCYVNAIVRFWAQDNGFGQRVNCSVNGVQFFKDGEAFTGGGTASVDEFEAVPGSETFADAGAATGLF